MFWLALVVAACSNRSDDENEIIDTTLNEAPAASHQTAAAASTSQDASRTSRKRDEERQSTPKRHANEASSMDEDNEGSERSDPSFEKAQSAKGDLRSLFSADDYPAAAQAAEAQGTAQAILTISPTGQVVGCDLARSTGNGALDSATCNILRRRARFTPARDSNGNPTTDTVITPPIVWRLEG